MSLSLRTTGWAWPRKHGYCPLYGGMGRNTLGIAQVSALQSLEESSPRRFRVMGSWIGSNYTVRSRGGVRTAEGPLYKGLLSTHASVR